MHLRAMLDRQRRWQRLPLAIGTLALLGSGVVPSPAAPTLASASTLRSAQTPSAIYKGSGVVGYLAPAATIVRWFTEDIPDFKEELKLYAPNVKVLAYNANLDVSTQLSQAQAAITQGANVLIVGSVAASQAGGLVNYANKNNVPVIVYERSINDANTYSMIGDDPHAIGIVVGQWLAKTIKPGGSLAILNGDPTDDFAIAYRQGYLSVLDPLFKSGRLKARSSGMDTRLATCERRY